MSASEKVTAYELALRLNGQNEANVTSHEISELAKKSGLLIVYPAGDDKSVWIEFSGALEGREESKELIIYKNGKNSHRCLEDNQGPIDFNPHRIELIILGNYYATPFCSPMIVSQVCSTSFRIKLHDASYAFGLVISMSVFDDLEREAAARQVAS